jgi:hypothetical protein
MWVTFILVSAAIAVLGILLFLAQQRSWTARWLKDPSKHLRPVDLTAFRNLIDPAEEQYLRDHLPVGEFRAIQKERQRAAVQYVKAVGGNAGVLLRLGQAARLDANAEIAAEAESLVNAALQLRLASLLALTVLHLRILFPGRQVSLHSVAERYQTLTGKVALFTLHYPLHGVKAGL